MGHFFCLDSLNVFTMRQNKQNSCSPGVHYRLAADELLEKRFRKPVNALQNVRLFGHGFWSLVSLPPSPSITTKLCDISQLF